MWWSWPRYCLLIRELHPPVVWQIADHDTWRNTAGVQRQRLSAGAPTREITWNTETGFMINGTMNMNPLVATMSAWLWIRRCALQVIFLIQRHIQAITRRILKCSLDHKTNSSFYLSVRTAEGGQGLDAVLWPHVRAAACHESNLWVKPAQDYGKVNTSFFMLCSPSLITYCTITQKRPGKAARAIR